MTECEKCSGCGWVWNYMLDSYRYDPSDCGIDDTRYGCDACDGTGVIAFDWNDLPAEQLT